MENEKNKGEETGGVKAEPQPLDEKELGKVAGGGGVEGTVEGTLAVALFQQVTDTIAQGLTSSIDQAKKIDTQIKRTLNS